jgi:hypothetical protein
MAITFLPIQYCPGSYAQGLVATSAILLFFSWLTVGLRLYTRTRIVHSVGWDDYLIVLANILFTCFCVLVIIDAYVVSEKTAISWHTMTIATSASTSHYSLFTVLMS